MIIFGGVYFGINMYSQYVGQQDNEELSSIAEATTKAEKKVKNPIDFKSLQKKNDEIYAWIKVPDTKVVRKRRNLYRIAQFHHLWGQGDGALRP